MDLFSQPDSLSVEDLGLTSLDSLQEASDHVRSFLEANHSKGKYYYDKRHWFVSFFVNDLVWIKTHPWSEKLMKFTAKLASLSVIKCLM